MGKKKKRFICIECNKEYPREEMGKLGCDPDLSNCYFKYRFCLDSKACRDRQRALGIIFNGDKEMSKNCEVCHQNKCVCAKESGGIFDSTGSIKKGKYNPPSTHRRPGPPPGATKVPPSTFDKCQAEPDQTNYGPCTYCKSPIGVGQAMTMFGKDQWHQPCYIKMRAAQKINLEELSIQDLKQLLRDIGDEFEGRMP